MYRLVFMKLQTLNILMSVTKILGGKYSKALTYVTSYIHPFLWN